MGNKIQKAEVPAQSRVIVKRDRQQLLDEINEIKSQIRMMESGWIKRGETEVEIGLKIKQLKARLAKLESEYNRLLQGNEKIEYFNGGFNPNAPLGKEDKITLKDIDTIKEKEILNNEYENIKQGLIDKGAGDKIINNLNMIF